MVQLRGAPFGRLAIACIAHRGAAGRGLELCVRTQPGAQPLVPPAEQESEPFLHLRLDLVEPVEVGLTILRPVRNLGQQLRAHQVHVVDGQHQRVGHVMPGRMCAPVWMAELRQRQQGQGRRFFRQRARRAVRAHRHAVCCKTGLQREAQPAGHKRAEHRDLAGGTPSSFTSPAMRPQPSQAFAGSAEGHSGGGRRFALLPNRSFGRGGGGLGSAPVARAQLTWSHAARAAVRSGLRHRAT